MADTILDHSKDSHPKFKCRQYVANPAVSEEGSAPGDTFSIVSYNILAECHRVRWDYSYTAEEFLCQDYRHGLLMKELQYLDGDVVCLQEVNPDYFNNTLLPAMRKWGYDGLIKCRTTDYYNEGAATFFKTDVFELRDSRELSLTDIAHSVKEVFGLFKLYFCKAEKVIDKSQQSCELKTAAKNYLDRADVVLITQLRSKASGQVLTVGNVHLWWDSDLHPDVKTVQAWCAVQETVGMSGIEGAYAICGDFNSECSSPVYQLVRDGYLSDSSIQALHHVQELQLGNGLKKSFIDNFKGAFHRTSADLKSAYCTVKGSEPVMTCYTEKGWMLDYIFYSAKSLVVLGVLDIVNTDTVVNTGGLPSEDFPSDHLSLKTYFSFASVNAFD